MINRIELQILNPDGSRFIESPIVISEEQLKGQDLEAQFKIGKSFEFAVTGNKLQGEVINCEPSTVDCKNLQVTIKIKPQSPAIIPLTASTND